MHPMSPSWGGLAGIVHGSLSRDSSWVDADDGSLGHSLGQEKIFVSLKFARRDCVVHVIIRYGIFSSDIGGSEANEAADQASPFSSRGNAT
jgi:hypothetical protein